jgi:CHAD domain-containing protein
MIQESFYLLPNRDSPVRWRDLLVDELGLVADPAESWRLVYCDSFDWRLYHAGLRLEWLQSPGYSLLRLVRLDDGTIGAELELDALDTRFASGLPDSELRRIIDPLLDIRAFLPLVTLKVRSHCLRQEDDEGKTRTRLYVESINRLTQEGGTRLLQKHLRLQPLRGYEKSAQAVGRKLEKKHKLQAGDDSLWEQAMTAAGKQPGDYSSKLNIHLEPEMRADAAVRRVMLDLFHAMQVNEQGTIEDLDSEFLHDFRVAVRRTRSALAELKWVFPPATLKRFKREFAWLGSVTTKLRDLDVYLIKFNRYKAMLPEELGDGLEPLRDLLRDKQQIEQSRHLAVQLRSARYRRLKQQWQRYLESPLAKRPVASDAAKPIGEVARRRTWRMYKRVMREGRAITDESPPPELHELRKSCKKLRYLMEFFHCLYKPKAIRALIKELKQLQENLGDYQDLDVQIASLEHFAEEMDQRGVYDAAAARAMEALLATLHAQMDEVRAHFHERFERFSRKETRSLFRELFRPEPAKATP